MNIDQNIIQIFSDWSELKISIHVSEKEIYFKTGQIWWVSLGQNIGSEQNGRNKNFERPVLILKKFNATTFLSVPVSTKIKTGRYNYTFTNNAGTYCVNLSQIRLLSSKRLLRMVGDMSDNDYQNIRNIIRKFF